MLSEQQADAVAHEVLANEHQRQTEIRNSRARRRLRWVRWYYKFPELKTLEPWQQDVLLDRAMEKADGQWPVLLSCFVWLLCLMALLFLGPPTLQGFRGLIIASLVLGAPFVLIRRWQVRRLASKLRGDLFPEQ
jgi:hypothetical protein